MSANLPDTLALILSDPAPVLMLDACSLLDVARAPSLPNNSSGVVDAANRLLAGSDADRLWIVVAQVAANEFRQNINAVVQQQEGHLRRLRTDLTKATQVGRALGRGLPRAAMSDVFPAHLAEGLRERAEKLAQAALELDSDDVCRAAAGRRVTAGRAPAGQGHIQQYKDCEIFEAYLNLLGELRAAGFVERVAFVTSNTKDFGSPNDSESIVVSDLAVHRAEYFTDLAAAVSQLLDPRP